VKDSLKWDESIKVHRLDYKKEWQYLFDAGIEVDTVKSLEKSGMPHYMKRTKSPLRSYVYPDNSGLSREEMIEHFKGYVKYYRSKGLPENKITESYYLKMDIDLYEDEIRSDRKYGLDNILSSVENSAIILLAELKREENNSQEYIVTEILKDIYNFYRLGDKITYIPIGGSLEKEWDPILGDFYPPEMKLGDKVILTFSDKKIYDSSLFSNIKGIRGSHLNPYITIHDPVYMNNGKLLYAFRKFTLDDLRKRLKKSFNPKLIENFYKIDYKLKSEE
jgi:hypothetical protein